jgi:Na+-transporting methylmalonyl-CoA/oxaloacetate decarboxylase gamma subunit
MTQTEAWIVTFIGMSVVFFGLLLCVFFIQAFNRLARRLERAPAAHGEAAALPPASAPGEPVAGDILAVIATVLEVERKLYSSRPDAGLPLRRPAAQP